MFAFVVVVATNMASCSCHLIDDYHLLWEGRMPTFILLLRTHLLWLVYDDSKEKKLGRQADVWFSVSQSAIWVVDVSVKHTYMQSNRVYVNFSLLVCIELNEHLTLKLLIELVVWRLVVYIELTHLLVLIYLCLWNLHCLIGFIMYACLFIKHFLEELGID